MTRDEILNMPAGQDMDLLVAEEVLKLDSIGWNERFFHNRANFSTDIRAAWEVVERMGNVDELHDVDIRTSIRGWYCNIFNSFDSFEAGAETAPLAICRAALLAVEAE